MSARLADCPTDSFVHVFVVLFLCLYAAQRVERITSLEACGSARVAGDRRKLSPQLHTHRMSITNLAWTGSAIDVTFAW